MTYLDNYRTKLSSSNNKLQQAQLEYLNHFEKDDSYKNLTFLTPLGQIGTYKIHTLGKNRLAVYPDKPVPSGSIFQMRGGTWIVYDIKPVDDIVVVGRFEQVNLSVKWVDNGSLITTAAHVTDNLSQGISDERYIQIGDQKLILLLPINTNTRNIKRNKRLMIDQTPYLVEKVDKYSYNGCFRYTISEDVIRQGDSTDVCNANEITAPIADGIIGQDKIKQGKTEEYYLSISNVETPTTWSILSEYATLVLEGNKAKIIVADKMSAVGSNIILTADTYSKTIKITSLF